MMMMKKKKKNDFIKRFAGKPYKENLTILKVILTDKKWQAKIREFRRRKPTWDKLQSDKSLQRAVVKLVNEILDDAKLPGKLFAHSVGYYLLYDQFDAPGMNYLLDKTGDTLTVEFFRLPHANDWKMLQIEVRQEFQSLSVTQRVRVDERL